MCEPDPNWKQIAQTPGPDPQKAAIYNGGRSVGVIYEAIPVLNQLIQAAPTGPAYVLLGQMYAVKNDYKNAIETWKKALALADSSAASQANCELSLSHDV